jgi:hypothetical protein
MPSMDIHNRKLIALAIAAAVVTVGLDYLYQYSIHTRKSHDLIGEPIFKLNLFSASLVSHKNFHLVDNLTNSPVHLVSE